MATSHRLLILSAALVALAGAAVAATPPRDLHLVGDHWTAWDPPQSTPPGARVHVIERGDTLWDLAARFYGNPYLWPQLWEGNRYILDAHWIYPGDPLVIGAEATPIEEVVGMTEATGAGPAAGPQPPAEPGLSLGRHSGAPVPLGSEDDIYCSGFIGALDEPLERTVIGSEYENLAPGLRPGLEAEITGQWGKVDTVKIDLSSGDIVYLDGGELAGLFPGTLYTVIAPGDRVTHPVSGRVLGRYHAYKGRIRVLSVQDETAIAEIVHSCRPIRIGDRARPFEPEPVPLGRRTPNRGINDPVSAASLKGAPMIVLSEGGMVSMGQDHVVYIDRGAAQQVAPGDLFTVYRLNPPGRPPVVLGEIAVLSVRETTAIAKILESRYTIHVGDRLDLKSP